MTDDRTACLGHQGQRKIAVAAQTIELDGNEHVLHGTREWGFETLEDGGTRFYTRGISVEDVLAADGVSVPLPDARVSTGPFGPLPVIGVFPTSVVPDVQQGEFALWSEWTAGVARVVENRGGSVVAGSEVAEQTLGPSGRQMLESFAPEQHARARESRVADIDRVVARLESELERGDFRDHYQEGALRQRVGLLTAERRRWEEASP